MWAVSRDGLRPELSAARFAAEEYDVESEWKSGRIMEDIDGTIEVFDGMPCGTISEGVGTVTVDGGLLSEGKSGEVAFAEENGFPQHFEAVGKDAESVDDVTGFHEAFLGTEVEEANDEDVFMEGGETEGMGEGSRHEEVAYKVPGGVAFMDLDSGGASWNEDDWGDGDWGVGDVSGDHRENGEGKENRL